jgi:hypothetical protein
VGQEGADPGALCDALLHDLLGEADRSDDVALVAVRTQPVAQRLPDAQGT